MPALSVPPPIPRSRLTHLAALLRSTGPQRPGVADAESRDRRLVADLCRLLAPTPPPAAGSGPTGVDPPAVDPPGAGALTPRLRQTLERLLAGDSEKEAARFLGVSPNTVHVYVKALYRHFDVNSRGELLARFVNPSGVT